MIQEIHDKSFFNSFKTVGSLVLMFFFLFVIGITFFLAQTSQDIRQEASNRKTTKIESYLSRLRKSKPSPTPNTSPTPRTTINPTITTSSTTVTPGSSPKICDTNGDNKIDVQDLSMVLSHWNKNDAPTADFNQDGIINIDDLSALLSNFGK